MIAIACSLVLCWSKPSDANVLVQTSGPELLVSQSTPDGSNDQPSIAIVSPGVATIVWSGDKSPTESTQTIRQRTIMSMGNNGSETQINISDETATRPRIKFNLASNGIIVWEDFDLGVGEGGSHRGIMARQVGPDGVVYGDPFWVNQTTIFHQRWPDAAIANDGSFFVVWMDLGHILYDTEKSDIFGRFYNADGTPRTNEFLVEPTESGYPFQVRVVALPSREYAVVWSRYSEVAPDSFDDLDVMIRILSADGQTKTTHRLNSSTEGGQSGPDIAVCSDGRMLVAWESDVIVGDEGRGIVARWLNPDGTALSDEIHVNAHIPNAQKFPVVTVTEDCYGIVVWQSPEQDGDKDGLFGRLLTPGGGVQGDEFQINTTTEGDQGVAWFRSIAVKASANNGFIAAWPSNHEGYDSFPLMAQWFCLDTNTANVCGDATCRGESLDVESRQITVQDAQTVLRGAIGLSPCDGCRCDLNGSGDVTVSDALATLRLSIDLPAPRSCPACM